MSLFVLFGSLLIFVLAYRYISPKIGRILGLDPDRPTPAHTMRDGVDYVPAPIPILFGHHFASIAGAAPIVGPVIAAAYGWGPVVIWIILGGVFIGAVHDFSVLMASLRHSGRSMGEVLWVNMGQMGKLIFLLFLWSSLVLLMAAYLVVVANTFVSIPSTGTSSLLFIGLAVLFGLSIYRLHAPIYIATIIGVIFLALCIVLGWYFPLNIPYNYWLIILIAYMFVASVTPVWILLQPRDYLNSFLLYALLLISFFGIIAIREPVHYPAFITWNANGLGFIFPILFVTVACGAISGYHAVVSSGTTSKQLNRESDARPIGYGAMLVESLLAIIAIITVMILSKDSYNSLLTSEGPLAVFSHGIGYLLEKFGINRAYGVNFAALAACAFVMTTLDTATRLARFAFQEFFTFNDDKKIFLFGKNRYVATFVTVVVASLFAYSGQWKIIWPIFGSANQLLAALSLLAVSLWLRQRGVKSNFLRIPMIFMFMVTISAFIIIAWKNFFGGNYPMAAVSIVLLGLSITLIASAAKKFWWPYT